MTEDEKRAATGPLKTAGARGRDQRVVRDEARNWTAEAACTVWIATLPRSSNAKPWGGPHPVLNGVIPWAIDPDSAERLGSARR